jgi:hypothetical protein
MVAKAETNVMRRPVGTARRVGTARPAGTAKHARKARPVKHDRAFEMARYRSRMRI